MPKEKMKDARIQVNISPSPATLEKLDDLVIRFGERHKNVKNRNVAAADILDKFVDVYVYLVEEQDKGLQKQIDALQARLTIRK